MNWAALARRCRDLSSTSQWRWLMVLLALTAATAIDACWRGTRLMETLQSLRAVEAAAEHAEATQTASLGPPQPHADLTSLLPSAPIPEPDLLRAIQRAAQGAQVDVLSQSLSRQAPSPQQLGRQEVSLNLRGSYPAIKTLLRELVHRWPGATISSIKLQRDSTASQQNAPGALDATVHLVVWSAPASGSSSLTATH